MKKTINLHKIHYLFLVAAVSLLLLSCESAKNESDAQTTQKGSAREEETAGTSIEGGNSAEGSKDHDIYYDEDILYGTYADESHAVVNMFEEDGVRMEYIHALDYQKGCPFEGFRITNVSQETIHVELLSISLNRDMLTDAVGEWNTWSIGEGDVEIVACPAVSKALRYAENEGIEIKELMCVFQIGEKEKEEEATGRTAEGSREIADIVEKKDALIKVCSVPVSEETPYAWLCEPLRGMSAEKQTVFENDDICIELLGCGRYFTDYSYMEEEEYPMEGILLYENKSAEEILCRLTGVQLNGTSIYFSSEGTEVDTIPAGLKRFVKFSVEAKDMEEQHIGRITDLSLQFLTDRRQTGWSGEQGLLDGGDWYPVTLSVNEDATGDNRAVAETPVNETDGTIEEDVIVQDDAVDENGNDSEEGTTIYEDDWIRMDYSDGYFDGYRLAVTNKSSENVELKVIPSEETIYAGYDLYIDDESIGSNSKAYKKLELWINKDPEKISTVSFRIRVLKQGGNKLLHESEEWITLPPEPMAENSVRPASGQYMSGKDIPVLVNGISITLGELSLQEFMDLTGMSIAEEDVGKVIDSMNTEYVNLETGKDSASCYVSVENYGAEASRAAEECTVCMISYRDYAVGDDTDSLISVGGISIGDTKEKVASTFGKTEDDTYFSYSFYNYSVSFSITDSGRVEEVACQESYYYEQ